MPGVDAFARLGLFVRRGFLDRSVCEALSAAMAVRPSIKGTVAREHDECALDESVRRVRCVDIGVDAWRGVRERLAALQRDVAVFFGRALDGCHGPDFLAYDVGGVYTPHVDNGAVYRTRLVSVVLFLNCGAYTGGELTFHGLIDEDPWRHCPLPLEAEPGLLVAFPSGMRHEVRPVRSGSRYTVAAWFTGAS